MSGNSPTPKLPKTACGSSPATDVAVIVPYRGGEPHRDRNWRHVQEHYASHHPEWELIHADCDGPWSKGAAVNAAVAETTAALLALADADSFVPPDCLREAIDRANTAPWVVPHRNVYRLTAENTDRFLTDGTLIRKPLARPVYEGPPGGGISVVTREAFDKVGGIHPAFLGWGGEDLAFGWALDTLVGQHHRIGGDLIHLWHPHPSPDYRKPPESDALVDAYLQARWHPAQMRAVIAGHPYEPPPPGPERVFRTPRELRTCHIGTDRARFRDHIHVTRDPDVAEALLMFPEVEEVT